MRSEGKPLVLIRPMAASDRAAVVGIVESVHNFNQAEIACALELVDIYLKDKAQADYRIAVVEDCTSSVRAYACWGPVPLTSGTYDLYWIATHPGSQGQGFGRALMSYVETKVLEEKGRLLLIETSSKESYENTIEFYRSMQYEEILRIRDFYQVGDDMLMFMKRFSPQGDKLSNGTYGAVDH